MRQPFQASVYAVRIAGGEYEYLLLRRVPRPDLGLGSFWQAVTGGVEDGEEFIEAAKRELTEETGLVPTALEHIDYSYSFPMEDEWRHLYAAGIEEIVEYVFVAFIDGRQEPNISWEHDEWCWCSLEQALGLLTYAEDIESLIRCDSFVKARLGVE